MNKLAGQIALFFYRATAIHVVISLIFFLIAQIVSSHRGEGSLGISFAQYAVILLFSFVLAGACYLFRLPCSLPLKLLIHYVVCALCFYVIFIAAGKIAMDTPARFFVSLCMYTIFYAVLTGSVLLLRRLATREKRKQAVRVAEATYQKRF